MVLKIELYKDIAGLILYQDKNGVSKKFTLRKGMVHNFKLNKRLLKIICFDEI